MFFSAIFNQGFLPPKVDTLFYRWKSVGRNLLSSCFTAFAGGVFLCHFKIMKEASWEHWKMASGRNQSANLHIFFFAVRHMCRRSAKMDHFFLVVYNMLKATLRAVSSCCVKLGFACTHCVKIPNFCPKSSFWKKIWKIQLTLIYRKHFSLKEGFNVKKCYISSELFFEQNIDFWHSVYL